MRCPKHISQLAVESNDGFAGYTCGDCEGQWLPSHWVEALKHQWPLLEPDGVFLQLQERSVGPTALRCPSSCGVLTASSLRSVEIDWCPKCRGVWFDAGELRGVLTELAPPPKQSVWSSVDLLGALFSAWP